MLRTRKSLQAEIRLLKSQLENEQQNLQNEKDKNYILTNKLADEIAELVKLLGDAPTRISILEGQAELCEKLQDEKFNLSKEVETLRARVEKVIKKNQKLGQTAAAYLHKYGELSDEDFANYKDHQHSEYEQKAGAVHTIERNEEAEKADLEEMKRIRREKDTYETKYPEG